MNSEFFHNYFNILKLQALKDLTELKTKFENKEWTINPVSVEAVYNHYTNEMSIINKVTFKIN